jgi:transposase
MRGRRPRPVSIDPADLPSLQRVARSESLPWFQVRRARIVLANARGLHTSTIAFQVQCDAATVWRTCRRYERGGLTGLLAPPIRPGSPGRISPLQRAQIVQLACLEPVAKGLHLTHWSSEDLARQAVLDGIVPCITPRTIRRLLNEVDLQPHRTRYWRTARLDDRFKDRAEKVLWCYAHAGRLAEQGIWVVCTDEMPNKQVLERRPLRRAIPGSIEQQEFEYTRHGTVNLLTFLVVHTGRMEAAILEANDTGHYIPALEAFRREHRRLRGIFLVQDGGGSHIAAETTDYLAGCRGWWRPRLTPAHASWLNQGELLNHAFGHRYLKRGSWASRDEYIARVMASWPEYNRLYARPFEWTWTNQKMRRWFAEHAP